MAKGVSKSEYIKLIRRTNTALKRELKKPTDKQDLELIEESVESLAYYKQELDALRDTKHSTLFALFLRRAAVGLIALVLTFAVGATVAQAAGFRIWTAIFMRDAGYLRVDYVPEETVSPTEYRVYEDEEKSFFSFEDFAAEMNKHGFPVFTDEWTDYRFMEGVIRSTSGDYFASFTMTGDTGYLKLNMIAKERPVEKTSVWGLYDDIPITRLDIDGVDVAYQIDGSIAFATWQYGNMIFSFSMSKQTARIEELLYAIVPATTK